MVHQPSSRRILLTLSHGVVVPALSRRTGAPCRAVQTRWLVVNIADQVRLVGCRDRKGRVFRTLCATAYGCRRAASPMPVS